MKDTSFKKRIKKLTGKPNALDTCGRFTINSNDKGEGLDELIKAAKSNMEKMFTDFQKENKVLPNQRVLIWCGINIVEREVKK